MRSHRGKNKKRNSEQGFQKYLIVKTVDTIRNSGDCLSEVMKSEDLYSFP